jgi:hypothetical protein
MDGICAVINLCRFDRSNPLILVLYGDAIIFARCPEQLMRWCLEILACDVHFKDVGVWWVVDDPSL